MDLGDPCDAANANILAVREDGDLSMLGRDAEVGAALRWFDLLIRQR